MSETMFFAYEGGHPENRDAIRQGIAEYNAHQKAYRATTWEDLKIGGHILNAAVLRGIDECQVFCCDLTYQNHNVLFELGYAIGKRKKLLVLLNPSITGAKEKYSSSKILNIIGYDEFLNGKDVLRSLQQRKHITEISVDSLINVSQHEAGSQDLLFLSSAIENQAALDLSAYINKLPARVLQNKSSEVEYQPLLWYVSGIVKCRNILIHLLGRDKINTDLENAEYSLFAGLGCGLGKPVMLLAPKPFKAPIDYSDILIEYEDSQDCLVKTSTWLDRRLREDREQPPDNNVQTAELVEQEDSLLRLGIGYEIAEEEENNLLDYFIEIDAYTRATERTSCVITGRKGAGKTALFIRLREYFVQEREGALNVILKPESDELIESVELTRLYENEQSKRALLTTAWRLVLFAGLFRGIHEKVTARDTATINAGSIEDRILRLAAENSSVLSLGHFSTLAELYRRWDEAGFGRRDALEQVYRSLLGPISSLVKDYFREHRYTEVNILADNLDKTWDAQSDLRLQAEMVLSLLEYSGRLARELDSHRLAPHAVLILRSDIFEFVIKHSREPDKLEARRLEIDWNRYPNRLRDLVEARFRFILKISDESSVDHVWKDYFNLRRGHPFDVIMKVVVARPRDLIYFVTKLFESAINNGHIQVQDDDFGYAVDAYSNFLNQNMIAETRAEFPEVREILIGVQKKYPNSWLGYYDFRRLLKGFGYGDDRIDQFVDFLFGKDYLVAYQRDGAIRNRNDLSSALNRRRLFIFPGHRVYVRLHPRGPNKFTRAWSP